GEDRGGAAGGGGLGAGAGVAVDERVQGGVGHPELDVQVPAAAQVVDRVVGLAEGRLRRDRRGRTGARRLRRVAAGGGARPGGAGPVGLRRPGGRWSTPTARGRRWA